MRLNLRERIAEVQERIRQAAQRAGRQPGEIILVGVTKGVDPEVINQAFDAGVITVGENRVQEMLAKINQVARPVEWHFVGTLQTNKVRQVLDKVALIHSLDRFSLAEEMARVAHRQGIIARVLVQVNISGEATKRGLKAKEVIPFLAEVSKCESLQVEGLMTIAPLGKESEARHVFCQLRKLAEEVKKEGFPRVQMRYLSMGMTDDFEVAIEEGSNMVRIGRGLFGPRS